MIIAHQGKDTELLQDLKVLDLADEKASFCSKLLADMGARVIKVERPGGDKSRWIGPFWRNKPDPEGSLFFWYSNTSKLGITLNLESEVGRDLFIRLASRADVVVESFPPGYLEELGLDYGALREVNPRLILASVTGFGQTGPYAAYESCDLVTSALGGQMYVTGDPDISPLRPHGQQSLYIASLFAAIGILIALQDQKQTGMGQHIDVSSQEAVAATLEHVMVRYFYEKVVASRQGNLHWTNSCCILPCKDGHIFITFNREWKTLVELLDSEGMAADLKEERWDDEAYRRQHISHIIEVMTGWTKNHTKTELFELGQSMRFPWAAVCLPQEVFTSPQLRMRNFFIPVDHQEADSSFLYPGTPIRIDSSSFWIRKRAPLIGEDNEQVYSEELGLSPEAIAEYASENII